ncbi:MAG: hypothetical protein V1810_02900 [Candidatus Beckwithbacteria bacterium]
MPEKGSVSPDLKPVIKQISEKKFREQLDLLAAKLPSGMTLRKYNNQLGTGINLLWLAAKLEKQAEGTKFIDFYSEIKIAGVELLGIDLYGSDGLDIDSFNQQIWNSMVVVAPEGKPSLFNWAKRRLELKNQAAEEEGKQKEVPAAELLPNPPTEEKKALEIPDWLEALQEANKAQLKAQQETAAASLTPPAVEPEKSGEESLDWLTGLVDPIKPEQPEQPELMQSGDKEGSREAAIPDWMAGLRGEEQPKEPEEKKESPEIEIKMNEFVPDWAKKAVTIVQMGDRVIIAPDKPELQSDREQDSFLYMTVANITAGDKEVKLEIVDMTPYKFHLNISLGGLQQNGQDFLAKLDQTWFRDLNEAKVESSDNGKTVWINEGKYFISESESGIFISIYDETDKSKAFKNLCEITTVVVNKWLGLTEGEESTDWLAGLREEKKPEEEKKAETPPPPRPKIRTSF